MITLHTNASLSFLFLYTFLPCLPLSSFFLKLKVDRGVLMCLDDQGNSFNIGLLRRGEDVLLSIEKKISKPGKEWK